MSMFTSCGWFFDDPSGLETRQVLRYAARAIELAREVSPVPLEPEFLERLERVVSNDGAVGNARRFVEGLKAASHVAELRLPS